jgi:hypothetical protein
VDKRHKQAFSEKETQMASEQVETELLLSITAK